MIKGDSLHSLPLTGAVQHLENGIWSYLTCYKYDLYYILCYAKWYVLSTVYYTVESTIHLVPEGGSNDIKFSNGGKWLFWKVLMSTVIPQNFKSGPLGDFE